MLLVVSVDSAGALVVAGLRRGAGGCLTVGLTAAVASSSLQQLFPIEFLCVEINFFYNIDKGLICDFKHWN